MKNSGKLFAGLLAAMLLGSFTGGFGMPVAGTIAETSGTTSSETASAAYVDGYFEGMNLKITKAITGADYHSIATPTIKNADLTNKYLAFRLYERSGLADYAVEPKISGLSMPADNSGIAVYYMDVASESVREGRSWWDVRPGTGFNGWVILDAGSMAGNLAEDKTISFGFAEWSGLLDADFGGIVSFEKPQGHSYAELSQAVESAAELYTFASGEDGLAAFTSDFVEGTVAFTRTKNTLDVVERPTVPVGEPVDGYFEGMNLSFETLTDYRSVSTPAVKTGDLTGKYIAFQMADKTNSDYQIDMKISGQVISNAPVYYVNVGRGRVSAGVSPWSLSVSPSFVGYVVIDCSSLSVPVNGEISFSFGFHQDWSSMPDIDFGAIKAIDVPSETTVEGFSAAWETGEALYDFAGTEDENSVNPKTVFDFGTDTIAVSRTHATLGGDDLPSEQTPAYSGTVGDAKVMNFELEEGDSLADFVGNAVDYPVCTFSVAQRAADATGEGGKALHVKLGESTGFQHSAVEVKPRGYGAEIEASAKGLTFFIKNYQDSGFFINVGFDLGQRWVTKWDGDYAIYQLWNTKTNKESTQSGASDGLYIPAGFEGYVRVSFEQFHAANWVVAPMEWEEAIATYTAVTYLSIDVNTDAYAGYEFDIDDIGWYYEEAKAENLFLNFADGRPGIAELMTQKDYFAKEE
mgnify:CR=1 FL=1